MIDIAVSAVAVAMIDISVSDASVAMIDNTLSVAIVDTFANATGSAYYKAGNIIVDGQDIYIVTA